METYYGHVRTPADAIILFEACRIGLLPRVVAVSLRALRPEEARHLRVGEVTMSAPMEQTRDQMDIVTNQMV